jgi:hypothetical protein
MPLAQPQSSCEPAIADLLLLVIAFSHCWRRRFLQFLSQYWDGNLQFAGDVYDASPTSG